MRTASSPLGIAATSVPAYLSSFSHDQMTAWLNKQVMLAFTSMMLMAEVLGYDTAPMEGFIESQVRKVLGAPDNIRVVALLAIGHSKGQDKFNGERFDMGHTVFGEEFGKPLKL